MSVDYQIGDYYETYRTFKLDVPERYNWAYEVFDAWGQDSSKVAMVWVGRAGVAGVVAVAPIATGRRG